MMEAYEKPKKRWQNLLHKKCPNCDTKMETKGIALVCPNPNLKDPNKSCFFIKKETAVSYLLDPDHPANFCLSPHERATVEEAIRGFGIVLN